MDMDFDVNKSATNPAFFFTAKIIAVPGNHDGETFAGTDPTPLRAFLANCWGPRPYSHLRPPPPAYSARR
jgi:hypothetical protein